MIQVSAAAADAINTAEKMQARREKGSGAGSEKKSVLKQENFLLALCVHNNGDRRL